MIMGKQGSGASLLAIHMVSHLMYPVDPLARDDALSLLKVLVIPGWKLNLYSLEMSLPQDMYTAWAGDISLILKSKHATFKDISWQTKQHCRSDHPTIWLLSQLHPSLQRQSWRHILQIVVEQGSIVRFAFMVKMLSKTPLILGSKKLSPKSESTYLDSSLLCYIQSRLFSWPDERDLEMHPVQKTMAKVGEILRANMQCKPYHAQEDGVIALASHVSSKEWRMQIYPSNNKWLLGLTHAPLCFISSWLCLHTALHQHFLLCNVPLQICTDNRRAQNNFLCINKIHFFKNKEQLEHSNPLLVEADSFSITFES